MLPATNLVMGNPARPTGCLFHKGISAAKSEGGGVPRYRKHRSFLLTQHLRAGDGGHRVGGFSSWESLAG